MNVLLFLAENPTTQDPDYGMITVQYNQIAFAVSSVLLCLTFIILIVLLIYQRVKIAKKDEEIQYLTRLRDKNR